MLSFLFYSNVLNPLFNDRKNWKRKYIFWSSVHNWYWNPSSLLSFLQGVELIRTPGQPVSCDHKDHKPCNFIILEHTQHLETVKLDITTTHSVSSVRQLFEYLNTTGSGALRCFEDRSFFVLWLRLRSDQKTSWNTNL